MDKNKKRLKLLVIGGTGFIGYHLCKRAVRLGWSVTSFSLNKPKKLRKLFKVKYCVGNITLKKSLKKIDKNFDFVVNLGGYVNHINKNENLKTHFVGCKNLVKIFSKRKIKCFLHIGSGAEYENIKSPHSEQSICNPKSIYGRPKFLATKYLLEQFKKKNFPCCIVRLYQVFGKKQDTNRIIPFIIRSCFLNKNFPCSNGNQRRDFIEVGEVITLFIKILKKKKILGQIINIGSGELIKIKSLIKKIRKIIKKGNPQFGKIKLRKEEAKDFYPSIKKSIRLLTWKPKKNFNKNLISLINSEKKLIKKLNFR